MSDRLGRKQIAKSTIHQSNIPISRITEDTSIIHNFSWNRERHGEGRFNCDNITLANKTLSGDVETRPNFDEEDDRQFWGDDELDTSNSDNEECDGISEKFFKSKYRKKVKRTFNSVISKPRILKLKFNKYDIIGRSNFNVPGSYIKVPDWRFSNLPVAAKYRPSSSATSSTDSEENIQEVRKKDWIERRKEKRRKLNLSLSSDSISSDEELCDCCVIKS